MKPVALLVLFVAALAACTVPTVATTPPTTPPPSTASTVPENTTATTTPTTTVVTTTTLAPAPDGPIGADGPLEGEWIRVYASLETTDATEQHATAVAETIPGSKVLLSDNYPSLNPGYWVVYDGGFDDKFSADICPTALPEEATCYPRWIGDPVVSDGSLVGLIAGELFELTPGAGTRTLGFVDQGGWVSNLELNGSRDGIIFGEGTEDYWYTCESSAGYIYSYDFTTQTRKVFSTGITPRISPDGSKVAWLHNSTCIDDPTTEGWVLTPADTIMVRDLGGATDHIIAMNVPLDGPFDPRELAQLVWIDDDTLLVSDFNTSFYRVPVEAKTFGGDPMLDGVVGTIMGYGNDGLIVLDDNGGEGDAFEWWLLGVNLDTASAEFLMTGPDYITLGINPDGEIVFAVEDTFWPRGEQPFKAPGYIEAIDW
jgi:hypothetical protein